jgi:hypothetical protein
MVSPPVTSDSDTNNYPGGCLERYLSVHAPRKDLQPQGPQSNTTVVALHVYLAGAMSGQVGAKIQTTSSTY